VEPRQPQQGPRSDPNNHAEGNGREEDEPEGRSKDSEEFRPRKRAETWYHVRNRYVKRLVKPPCR